MSRQPTRIPAAGGNGFTLIELLVVIANIAMNAFLEGGAFRDMNPAAGSAAYPQWRRYDKLIDHPRSVKYRRARQKPNSVELQIPAAMCWLNPVPWAV